MCGLFILLPASYSGIGNSHTENEECVADPARHRWLGAEAKQNRGLKTKPITGLEGETGNFAPATSAGSSFTLEAPCAEPDPVPTKADHKLVGGLPVAGDRAHAPAQGHLSDMFGIVHCPLAYEVSCCPVGQMGFWFCLCPRRPPQRLWSSAITESTGHNHVLLPLDFERNFGVDGWALPSRRVFPRPNFRHPFRHCWALPAQRLEPDGP